MQKIYHIILFLFILIPARIHAQDSHQDNPQDGHFTGSVSLGPNYYFNNIKTFGDYVKPVNYSAFARIMWNSRYLVSLGVETGFNKFYRVSSSDNADIKAALEAIPLHLVIGMRIAKTFYANFSFGPSLLLNPAHSGTESINNKVLSYADGSVCFGYRKRLNRSFCLGAELKFNFSTKAEDMNLALPIVLSYDF